MYPHSGLAKNFMRIDFLFKTFADETRLRILNLLALGELNVTHITRVLDISQPKASRHLAQLRFAGLVDSRRNGTKVIYFLAESSNKFQKLLLDHIKKGYFHEIPKLREDIKKAVFLKKDFSKD